MSERERCLFCTREVAGPADWEANANLPSGKAEDEEAERRGLNALCWEPEDYGCTEHALEVGRPANLADALRAMDEAEKQRDELLARLPLDGEGAG